MGYRQNNPNFQGGNLMELLLPLLMSGGGMPQAQQPDPMRGGGRLTSRDPGPDLTTPYVIGGGRGGTYTDFEPPGGGGPWDELFGLGTNLRRGSALGTLFGLPPWLLNVLGRGGQEAARWGGYDPNAPPLEGPPAPRETPIPRSVINDGWEHLFLGDSEFFWNSIQPNVRGGMGPRGGFGIRGDDPAGAFRGSGGWGLPYF